MTRISIRLAGSEALAAAFRKVGKVPGRKVLRSAAGAGATPLNKDLKRRARQIKMTGLLSKSIGQVRRQYSGGGSRTFVNVVGSRGGFRTARASLKFKKKKYPKRGGKLGPRKKKLPAFVNPMKYFRFVQRGTKVAASKPIFTRAVFAQRKNMENAMVRRSEEILRVEIKKISDEQIRIYRMQMSQFQGMTGIA